MKTGFKYLHTILFFGFSVLFLTACGGDKTNTERLLPEVEKVDLSASSMEILSTETIQFGALTYYSDGTTRDATSHVSWSVSDRTVATINTDGLLTPRGPGGDVNVTVGYGGYYETGTVTITPLTSIIVSAQDDNMTVNSTYQLNATGYFGSKEDNLTSDITVRAIWVTSDQAIALVDGNGLMYTYSAGIVEVNATLFDINGTIELNITE